MTSSNSLKYLTFFDQFIIEAYLITSFFIALLSLRKSTGVVPNFSISNLSISNSDESISVAVIKVRFFLH